MKILMIHNRYLIGGGEDQSTQAEVDLLRDHGHTVDYLEFDNQQIAQLGAAQTALRAIWSHPAYNAVRERLSGHDLVHVQNFFPLVSPAVYYAAREARVPVVQTLRNYRLLCPSAVFFRAGRICEDCLGHAAPWPGVVHGCYRADRAATAAVAMMISVHRLLRTYQQRVDVLIALTEFAREKYIQGGLPAAKILVKPNFLHSDPGMGKGDGHFALFVGRLSAEKGIDTLLTAWQGIGARLPLKIVGTGPLLERVLALTRQTPAVQYLGPRPIGEVYDLMGQAKLLLFPSEWYEPFGRVAIEAFAKGTPVLATKLGSLATLVEHGRTGLHFPPGDPQALAQQVDWLLTHPVEHARMRHSARAEFEAKYTAPQNYQALLAIYQQALHPSQPNRRPSCTKTSS
ncbi:glycosyltransferase family 4 protein [Anthocerotibacter panamensis]|uniref:glycosyltransferase family 4 protein n=1 Tax=Anthocerotibacter panamensis TaxID=2857077 RepID=UPI001C406D47|nr:glycosyltransferase family 4 protein [Anthocerotibacter panamensis]